MVSMPRADRRLFTTGSGLELMLHASGSGPQRLLLVHGITAHGPAMLRLADAVGDLATCTAPDLRGHGWSARAERYLATDYVDDLVDLLTDIGPAVVYGHSLGGLCGLALATRVPHLVTAVIAEDPPLFTHWGRLDDVSGLRTGFSQQHAARVAATDHHALWQALRAARPDHDPLRSRGAAERLWRCDPDIWLPILDDSLGDGLEDPSVQPPAQTTLLLQAGAAGGVLDQASIERVVAAAPQVQVERFPDAGHAICATDLERVVTILRGVLQTVP